MLLSCGSYNSSGSYNLPTFQRRFTLMLAVNPLTIKQLNLLQACLGSTVTFGDKSSPGRNVVIRLAWDGHRDLTGLNMPLRPSIKVREQVGDTDDCQEQAG